MEENKNTSLIQLVLGENDELIGCYPLLLNEDVHTCTLKATEENDMFEDDISGDYFGVFAKKLKHIFTRKNEKNEVMILWELELVRDEDGVVQDRNLYADKSVVDYIEKEMKQEFPNAKEQE